MWFLAQMVTRIALWSVLVAAIGYVLSPFFPLPAFVIVIPFGFLGLMIGVELVIPPMKEESWLPYS